MLFKNFYFLFPIKNKKRFEGVIQGIAKNSSE
jgi:hypothetical protein